MRAALVVALLTAATAALAQDAAERRSRKYYYEDVQAPFFAKDARAGVYRSIRPGAPASEFSIEKGSATFRVFVIGGSVAARSFTRQAFAEPLARVLPGINVEAIDCGMGGYDSFRDTLVLSEALAHEPDVVVLLTGHNEMISGPPVALWRLKAAELLERLGVKAKPARPGPLDDDPFLRAARRDARLEANLRDMLRQAARRRIATLAVSPPLNYRDGPSDAGFPEDPRFAGAWIKFLRKDYRGAIADWARLADSEPGQAPLALFLMGRAEAALGKERQADRCYLKAMEADSSAVGRCGPACGRLIAKISAQENASWLDLDAAFRSAAGGRLPGLDMFVDSVHWRHEYDALAAWAVIDAMSRMPRSRGLPWDRAALAELGAAARRKPAESEDSILETLRYGVSFADRTDGRLSLHAVCQLQSVFARRPLWARDIPALAARAAGAAAAGNAWGMAQLKPNLPRLYWHAGVARLLEGDRKAALRDFAASGARAAAFVPATASAPKGDDRRARALEYQNAGQRALAEKLLRSLAAEDPSDPVRQNDLGVCLFLGGSKHEAARRFRQAIALEPLYLPAYLSLGAEQAASGLPAEAARTYERALALGIDERDPRIGEVRRRLVELRGGAR